MRRPFTKPDEGLTADLEIFGISSRNIGFVDLVKPGSLPMMIAWKRFHQSETLLLGKWAQELAVVWGRTIICERQQQAGPGLLGP